MNKENIAEDSDGTLSKLTKLINSWSLITISVADGFSKLPLKILRNLYEGQGRLKIKRIIESELCVTYRLYASDFDAEKLSNEITTWWNEYE